MNIMNNPNFVRWFGSSKMVDNNGNPEICYHGSDNEFEDFSETHTAYGYFFTPDEDTAAYYGDILYKVYLRMENPLDLTDDSIREKAFEDCFSLDNKEWYKYDENYGEYKELNDRDAINYVVDLYEGNEEFWKQAIPYLQDLKVEEGETVEDVLDFEGFDWEALGKVASTYKSLANSLKEDRYYLLDKDVQEVEQAYNSQDFYMNYQDDLMKYAQGNGFDGVIFDDPSSTGQGISYVVFHANQIKSAIGNNGNYDNDSDSIMESTSHLKELHNAPAEYHIDPNSDLLDAYEGASDYVFEVGRHRYHSIFLNQKQTYEGICNLYMSQIGIDIHSPEVEDLFRGSSYMEANKKLDVCFYGFTIEKGGNPYHDRTSGTGNAFTVITTVIETIKEFVNNNHVDILTFGSRDITTLEKSKYVAYKGLIRRLQKEYNYEVIEKIRDDTAFFFVILHDNNEHTEMPMETLLK